MGVAHQMPNETSGTSSLSGDLDREARPNRDATGGGVIGSSPALERVLAAGIDLFYESGFLATTIRAITGACGLTAPAYYNHFESKEALLYTIISDADSTLELQLDGLRLDGSDPSKELRLLVKTLVEFNLTRPKEARIANREYGFLQSPYRDEVVEHRRHVRSLFESVLASPGPPRGLLHLPRSKETDAMEVRLLAISIINLCIASSDWFRSEGPLSVDAVSETCCRLALRMALITEDENDDANASTVGAGKGLPLFRRKDIRRDSAKSK
jgi:AcrR family transcriptional regulator